MRYMCRCWVCAVWLCTVTGTPRAADSTPLAAASWADILLSRLGAFAPPEGCTIGQLQLFDRDGSQIIDASLLQPGMTSAVRCGALLPPCPVQPQHDQAVQLLLAGQYQSARDLLIAVVKQCDEHPEILNNLGEAHRVLDQPVPAEAAYRRAISLRPWDSVAPTRNLGRVLVAQKRHEEAIPVLQRVAANDRAANASQDEAAASTALGLALAQLDRAPDALEALWRAVALTPESSEAWHAIGLVHRKKAERLSITNMSEAVEQLVLAVNGLQNAVLHDPSLSDAWCDCAHAQHELDGWLSCSFCGTKRTKSEVSAKLAGTANCSEPCRELLRSPRLQSKAVQAEQGKGVLWDRPKTPDDRAIGAPHKLLHDSQQLSWLVSKGALPASFTKLANLYNQTAHALPRGFLGRWPDAVWNNIHKYYNRAWHYGDGSRVGGSALQPQNWDAISARYHSSEPSIVHFDNLLSTDCLAKLQAYLEDSTIFYDVKAGYLGTYLRDGFDPPLLAQIASELREKLPEIFAAHPLHQAWAYKYSSEASRGIRVHADQAVVNVNLWITPDSANLDNQPGGLRIYSQEPPEEWDFEEYNSDDRQGAIYNFLEEKKSRKIDVAYKQNRVIIFNSKLLHETAQFSFKPGYRNRRINVTLLFGRAIDAHKYDNSK